MTTTIFEHNGSTIQVNVNHHYKTKESILTTKYGKLFFLDDVGFISENVVSSFDSILAFYCERFNAKFAPTSVEKSISSLMKTGKLAILMVYKTNDGLVACPPFLSVHVHSNSKIVGLHFYELEETHNDDLDLLVRKTTSNEIYSHEFFLEKGFYNIHVFVDEDLEHEKYGIFSKRNVDYFLNKSLGPSVFSIYKKQLEKNSEK